MRKVLYPLIAVLLVAATVAQVNATRDVRTVTPAQQRAEKSASASASRVVAEGRVVTYPGAEVTVGTDIGGTLERLAVSEKETVTRGDVIAVIRAEDTHAALSQARARVGEARADIRLFELESERARRLFGEDVGSRQGLEKALRDLDAARARRESALADVTRLQAVVAKSVIRAPISGVVVARHADSGETIAEGAEIITIADLSKTRVEVEVDEFDSARVRLGGAVAITAEGYEQQWPGTIEEIPDSVINRRLKPQDPAKPIDTRVLLVKVAFKTPTPLKLGQRVEVQIGGK